MLNAQDYRTTLRDGKMLHTLARQLRARPEDERLRFIEDVLSFPHVRGRPSSLWLGVQLANKCLGHPRSLEAVLTRCLLQERGRTLGMCLEAIMPRIGYRRTMRVLKDTLVTTPQAAVNIWWAHHYVGSVSEQMGIVTDTAYDLSASDIAQIEAARRSTAHDGDRDQT